MAVKNVVTLGYGAAGGFATTVAFVVTLGYSLGAAGVPGLVAVAAGGAGVTVEIDP